MFTKPDKKITADDYVCDTRGGGGELFETLTRMPRNSNSFRRGFHVPGSSNRVPEPGGSRLYAEVSNPESGCVLDDLGGRLRVWKLCCSMDRRGVAAWIRPHVTLVTPFRQFPPINSMVASVPSLLHNPC